MIGFENARIEGLAVHMVGEDPLLAERLASWDGQAVEERLKEFFFSSFNFGQRYVFVDDTDVNLNEVYSCACEIFSDPSSLLERSKDIARHLMDVFGKPGELYVAYFKGIEIDGDVTNGIGVFKPENKQVFLDVSNDAIRERNGISPKKMEKGCLMLDIGRKQPVQVFVIDSAKGEKAYWRNEFLHVEEMKDSYSDTNTVLEAVRQYAKQDMSMPKTEKIDFLNQSIQYFENNESYDFESFVSEATDDPEVRTSFREYVKEKELGDRMTGQFGISQEAVNNVKKKMRSSIRLDSDIEIKISANAADVSDLIVQGYDERKQMRYYIIYYNNEK